MAALCCRLLWEQRGHSRGHVTMWSRSAGSQVGRPSPLCWRLSRAQQKLGQRWRERKAGSRKSVRRRPGVLAGGYFSKNYHNDRVEVINIIPARQMDCFLKSFWIYLTYPSGKRSSRSVFWTVGGAFCCRFGLTRSPSMRPNNESEAEKRTPRCRFFLYVPHSE